MRFFTLTLTAVFVLPVLFSSCIQHIKDNEAETNDVFFDPMCMGSFNSKDSLQIEASFTECGEFGGHQETMILKSDKMSMFWLNYKVYPYNCDSSEHYNYSKLTPSFERNIVLNNHKKKALVDYIQRLVQAKIAEGLPQSNANNTFTIVNRDSSLLISVFGDRQQEIASYKKLVSALLQ